MPDETNTTHLLQPSDYQLNLIAFTAMKNRAEFLKPFEEKFWAARKEAERDRIIIELIKLETSHLSEPWILPVYMKWMRDRHRYRDPLERATNQQKGRYRPTDRKRLDLAKYFFLAEAIDRIVEQDEVTKNKAFNTLANRQAENPNVIFPQYKPNNEDQQEDQQGDQLELQIKSIYYKYKRRSRNRNLPWPYYGLDVVFESEAGEEFLIVRGTQKKVTCTVNSIDLTFFGDWEWRIPIYRIAPSE